MAEELLSQLERRREQHGVPAPRDPFPARGHPPMTLPAARQAERQQVPAPFPQAAVPPRGGSCRRILAGDSVSPRLPRLLPSGSPDCLSRRTPRRCRRSSASRAAVLRELPGAPRGGFGLLPRVGTGRRPRRQGEAAQPSGQRTPATRGASFASRVAYPPRSPVGSASSTRGGGHRTRRGLAVRHGPACGPRGLHNSPSTALIPSSALSLSRRKRSRSPGRAPSAWAAVRPAPPAPPPPWPGAAPGPGSAPSPETRRQAEPVGVG